MHQGHRAFQGGALPSGTCTLCTTHHHTKPMCHSCAAQLLYLILLCLTATAASAHAHSFHLAHASHSSSGSLQQHPATVPAGGDSSSEQAAPRAAVDTAPSCEIPKGIGRPSEIHIECIKLSQTCMDQQQFITYERKYQPSHSSLKPPTFNVRDLQYNWPNPTGNGDKFKNGFNLHYANVVIRVNTSEEACADLRSPAFSVCSRPLIIWTRWPYNVGEVYTTAFLKLYSLWKAKLVSSRQTLVFATPMGMRLPHYIRAFMATLFEREVVSLADFSARTSVPESQMPVLSNTTWEGVRVRCFEEMDLCQIKNRQGPGVIELGQHVIDYYRSSLPSVTSVFSPEDDDALKVVFASRTNSGSRRLLNEVELMASCNAKQPPAGNMFKRVKCVAHIFGQDMLYDIALMQATDVLVCVHGASCYNVYYMPPGASLIEIRPFHFPASWSNKYYAQLLEYEKKVFWWGIDITDPANSKPSEFQGSDVFREAVAHREHHSTLPWSALDHHLDRVLGVQRDPWAYKEQFVAGSHYITEGLVPIALRPDVGNRGWARFGDPNVDPEHAGGSGDADGADEDHTDFQYDEGAGGGGV